MSPADVAELRAAVAAGLRLSPVIRSDSAIGSWRKRPTRNPETFDAMLRKYPDATAWVTPLGSSVVGVRAVTKVGRDQRSILEEELGVLPDTISIRSPSGAETMLFAVNRKLPAIDLGSHLFILGAGRSIAAPPAVHGATGQRFAWIRPPSTIATLGSLPIAWGEHIAQAGAHLLAPVPNVRVFMPPSAPRRFTAGVEVMAENLRSAE